MQRFMVLNPIAIGLECKVKGFLFITEFQLKSWQVLYSCMGSDWLCYLCD